VGRLGLMALAPLAALATVDHLRANYNQQECACGLTNRPLRTGPGPGGQVADEKAAGN
jgi:hypothetical protein